MALPEWSLYDGPGRPAVLVDAGEEYCELRGAELRGTVEVVLTITDTGTAEGAIA